jgi:hypothetical protein
VSLERERNQNQVGVTNFYLSELEIGSDGVYGYFRSRTDEAKSTLTQWRGHIGLRGAIAPLIFFLKKYFLYQNINNILTGLIFFLATI